MVDYIKTTEVWEDLKNSINNGDEEKAEEIVHQLLDTMTKMKDDYEKTTVEIRRDLLRDVRTYCARNNYTMKGFMNVALETLLNIGGLDEKNDES